MKKLLALLLALLLTLAATACAQTAAPAQPTAAPEARSDTLVACFSATGNTRAVAEKLAALLDADLYEIVPAEPYTEEGPGYGNSGSRTSLEMDGPDARPEIAGEPLDLTGYTTLYLGYPIWHGEAPRILSTFVESRDLDGLTVHPFCTAGGSGIARSVEALKTLAGAGTWLEGQRFSASVSDEELQAWIDEAA